MEQKERAILSAILIQAHEDLKNNLNNKGTSKGLTLSERINSRREAIQFFKGRAFQFYCTLLGKNYVRYKREIQKLLDKSLFEFEEFLKRKKLTNK